MNGPLDAKHATTRAANAFNRVAFTIGAEAGNIINVALQLKDHLGRALAEKAKVRCYFASASSGLSLAALPTTVAIGTNGLMIGSASAIATLTDSSGGTANNTIAAIPESNSSVALTNTMIDDSPDEAAANAAIKAAIDAAVDAIADPIRDGLADLAAKVNAILNTTEGFTLVTNASGQVDINITKSGAATYYLVVEFPDGSIEVSSVITFAA